MRISLKAKFGVGFAVVAVITGLVAAWIGVYLIRTAMMNREQRQMEMDLNSAHEIYERRVDDIRTMVRLTAGRFFIKDDLLSGSMKELNERLASIREAEGLDILTLTDSKGKVVVRSHNPELVGDTQADDELVSRVLAEKRVLASTQIVSREELIKEGKDIAWQAYIELIPTLRAEPTEREEETSGMMIKAVAPVMNGDRLLGVLYGGELLNRNYEIVDKVKDIVYRGERYEGKDIGTVTIFQKDLRITTNVRKSNGERAVGTRLSEEVYEQIFEKGRPWFDRAFVVDDWRITAYEPIRNIRDEIIGVLYVGILEKKFADLRKHTLLIFLTVIVAGVLVSLLTAHFLTNGILRPIKGLVSVSKQIGKGNLKARVECNSRDEIGELSETFNSMISSLEERDERLREYAEQEIMKAERLATIGRLAAGVAHEINNPISATLTYVRLLSRRLEKEQFAHSKREDIERYLTTMEDEITRCGTIVSNLLDFAREKELDFRPTDLERVIGQSLALLRDLLTGQNAEISEEIISPLPEVIADPGQLQQVFMNIMLNAVQSMEDGGELKIRAEKEGENSVKIEFVDTGCGISESNLERIFEPFFSTKEDNKGLGLGLSIVQKIVKKHRGQIDVRSTIGKGTCVTVRLPVK
jgi:two-component system NtrC family sensor kinase